MHCAFFVCVLKHRCTVISVSVSQCVSLCEYICTCVYACICAMCEDKCVYCVFYSKHLCMCTFINFVFLFAYVCISKNLLYTCTFFTVFINYTTTYLYALLIQINIQQIQKAFILSLFVTL